MAYVHHHNSTEYFQQPQKYIPFWWVMLIMREVIRLVKAMVFPVVMYGCESWTAKKAEHRRTDAFELWCWRRLFRGPWTARRSNQSILRATSPQCSLEGLMLKLRLQHCAVLSRSVVSDWTELTEMGKQWKSWETLFSWAPKSLQMVTAAMKSEDDCFLEGKLWLT